MKLTEQLFKSVLKNIMQQQDKDIKHAESLGKVYHCDIDPTDNSLVVDSIFMMFGEIFNEDQLNEIKIFCYDQDFGRKADRTVNDLWNDLVKHIEVIYTYVNPQHN